MTVVSTGPDLVDEMQSLYNGDRGALKRAPALYARLRAEAPVLRVGPLTMVSRYEDAARIYSDHQTFSSVRGRGSRHDERRSRLAPGQVDRFDFITDFLDTWVVQMDPPDHTRVRGLVQRSFTPRRVNAMRGTIQEIIDRLLAPAHERGSIDLVREFAGPLPLLVICEMLGLDSEDSGKIRAWADAIGASFGTNFSNVDEAYEAMQSFQALVRRVMAERRSGPERPSAEQDLFDTLVAATEAEDGLTELEVVAMITLLLFAGHETTTNLISYSMVSLMENPDQAAKLRERPDLMRGAVNEFLRFNPSVLGNHRTALQEQTIQGVTIAPGDTVLLLLGSANRDELVFPDGDRLDVERPNSARHMGMGYGIHTCLGIWLAKLEAEIALGTLVTRYPGAQLTGPVELTPTFILTGPEEVTLRLRP